MQATITAALEACAEMVAEHYAEYDELPQGTYEGADGHALEMARIALVAAQVHGEAFYCPRCGFHLLDQATEQLPYEGYLVCAAHVEYPIRGAVRYKQVKEEGQ